MTNVFFWASRNPETETYRSTYPAAALDIPTRSRTTITKEDRDWADVVVGSNITTRPLAHFWYQVLADKTRVYDLDYNVWATPNREVALDMVTLAIGVADLVTVPTGPLRDAVHYHTGRPLDEIVVVPSAIPRDRVHDVQESRITTFGWALGADDAPGFDMVHRHLQRFFDNEPRERFQSIGRVLPVLPDDNLVHTPRHPWSNGQFLHEASLHPVVGGAYDACRSDVRALEAAAAWTLPVVSRATAYDDLTHGENCFKVEAPHAWGRSLRTLYNDRAMRRELGAAARDWVLENRTTDHTASLWRSALT